MHINKSDFGVSNLKDITAEKFEDKMMKTFWLFEERFKPSDTLFVYFIKGNENALLFINRKIEKPSGNDILITEEKLPAFFSTSPEGRKAFYEARILKPIRKLFED